MRLYSYLNEATEQKDKEYRKIAMEIYKQTYDWLKENENNLDDILENDSIQGEEVKVFDFSSIQNDYELLFVFRDSRIKEFIFADGGELGREPQIFIPFKENIPENFRKHRKNILHELIHYIDFIEEREYSSNKEYYNTPAEFNAYYQEVIEDIKEDFEKGRLKINNFKDFIKKVKKDYFDQYFLKFLNKKIQ